MPRKPKEEIEKIENKKSANTKKPKKIHNYKGFNNKDFI